MLTHKIIKQLVYVIKTEVQHMDYFEEIIKNVVRGLIELRQNYTAELSRSILGSLVSNFHNNGRRFYHAQTVNGKYKRKYLSSRSPDGRDMIGRLARKEYLQKSIHAIDKNIAALTVALKNYSSLDPGSIIKGMKRAYKLLDHEYFFHGAVAKSIDAEMIHLISNQQDCGSFFDPYLSSYRNSSRSFSFTNMSFDESLWRTQRMHDHEKWASEPYERNDYPFGDDLILTADGTRVRSKGEIILYEKFREFHAPFRYDMKKWFGETPVDGFWLSPDFTFEDANYDEFYLEYCGMMNDPEYVRHHLKKAALYEKAGIVPWKNIIYLYAADNSFDVGYIESIIRYQILPRL